MYLYRVYLDQLKSPDDAVRVVKESQSTEGAKMVARYTLAATSRRSLGLLHFMFVYQTTCYYMY